MHGKTKVDGSITALNQKVNAGPLILANWSIFISQIFFWTKIRIATAGEDNASYLSDLKIESRENMKYQIIFRIKRLFFLSTPFLIVNIFEKSQKIYWIIIGNLVANNSNREHIYFFTASNTRVGFITKLFSNLAPCYYYNNFYSMDITKPLGLQPFRVGMRNRIWVDQNKTDL